MRFKNLNFIKLKVPDKNYFVLTKLNYNLIHAQLNKILTRAGVKHLFGVKTLLNKASPLSSAITSKGNIY